MSEILLRAADARQSANDMKNEANEARQNFDRLSGKLQSLADSFRGQTARAFDAQYLEWKKSATDVIASLEGLGKFLEEAANAIEEVDTQLANQLKG